MSLSNDQINSRVMAILHAIPKDKTITNEILVTASGADSVQLPKAIVGLTVRVLNSGAQSLQVFANGSDVIINGVTQQDEVAILAGVDLIVNFLQNINTIANKG